MGANYRSGHIFRTPTTAFNLRRPGLQMTTAPSGTFLDAKGNLRTIPTAMRKGVDAQTRQARVFSGVARKMEAQKTAAKAREAKLKRVVIPRTLSGKQLAVILTRLGYQRLAGHGGASFTFPGKPAIHVTNDAVKVRVAKPHVRAAIQEFFERGFNL